MAVASNLRRLLRHKDFQRLFTIRAFTQSADGTLQVGMASHILFNPAQEPNAWSITAMLAITLLPFSLVGPFVSGLLDRWSRRTVALVVDLVRAALALVVAGLVLTDSTAAGVQAGLFAALMVALALNRFMLAGLAAGMQHTIDDDEFLTASALMPMIGPIGVLVGGGLAAAIRLLAPWSASRADALIFCCATAMWLVSAWAAGRLAPRALGPLEPAARTHVADVLHGLADAGRHLSHRRPALLGLVTITCQRALYGLTLVLAILLFRNHFHDATQVKAAMADIGLWTGASGVGFACSVALVPPIAHRIGMRATTAVMLVASAVVQLGPGQVLSRWPLVGASFLLGLFAQSLKVCVDTVVQAHCDDEWRGRIFVIYDGLFNAAVVVGAVLGALLLPADGLSRPVLVGLGVAYALLATAFWLASAPVGSPAFNRGTELNRLDRRG